MKNLVLVESPAKASTIEKYLDDKYKVLATYGHVRDLPTKEIGVDFENKYEPKYIAMKGKAKVIKDIKTSMKEAKIIYMAVDPDREGEAIGWHTAQALGLITKSGNKKKGSIVDIKRVVFHEITKSAV